MIQLRTMQLSFVSLCRGGGGGDDMSAMFWPRHRPCCAMELQGFFIPFPNPLGVISHLPARIWAGLLAEFLP